MKRLNETEYEILELISKNHCVTRMDLSLKLNISPAAISKTMKKLIEENLVLEDDTLSSKGGRPRKILKINSEYKKVIGINFGPGFIYISVSKIDGSIIETRKKKFQFKVSQKLITLLTDELDLLFERYNKNEILGIGLAVNGIVNTRDGSSIFSPHLKWSNIKLREYLENKFNLPVIVDNDVRAMLKAEIYKVKKLSNVMYIYIRDGIGSSIMINNKIFEGVNFCTGEIGHFIINPTSNSRCQCGKYGCLEAEYSSKMIRNKVIWELEKQGIELENNYITYKEIFEKASFGEEPYKAIVKEASIKIGSTVGNILNVLDIGNIIIAGDILHAKNIFLKNFEKGIDLMKTHSFESMVNIYTTEFGDDVEKYGAIFLVIMNLFSGQKIFTL
ncbi:ROK family transcriptional regulator [Streptobacillus moniliformis]|uniref:ROK family protein n=1 Tax=Streptobacillus moniliformis (strain ATCC 14647 / DSM 12112 / NCTC 10651 / 9901) TaxID=519441 RepID=D1AWX4_STRM9|nr:ROK family transcriptional regulator [Streptobacillus moniliformis]ACZ00800.1 ROK family protein [Streptobacillus moniliformis DSM 12112]QXW65553.1 ROK family transcriptional regulator [Streptobacillus moniliformis]SQA14065.1 Making large colonies protein [Streptobacillus moniliformis]